MPCSNENARTNRNNKRTEIDRFDWFVERIQTRVAFGWLSERSGIKTSCPKNFLEINRYLALTVILQHDWLIEQCLLHIRVFFGGKTRSPCFDLFIHWLIKQITITYRNQFSRSQKNRLYCREKDIVRKFWWDVRSFSQEGNFVCRLLLGRTDFNTKILKSGERHRLIKLSVTPLEVEWH